METMQGKKYNNYIQYKVNNIRIIKFLRTNSDIQELDY